jgi:hypothetical protein
VQVLSKNYQWRYFSFQTAFGLNRDLEIQIDDIGVGT